MGPTSSHPSGRSVIVVGPMSREQTQRLVGRVLQLPETGRHRAMRLKVIRVVADPADPQRITIHGIRINAYGSETEGRTIILTPAGIADYLEHEPPPRERRH